MVVLTVLRYVNHLNVAAETFRNLLFRDVDSLLTKVFIQLLVYSLTPDILSQNFAPTADAFDLYFKLLELNNFFSQNTRFGALIYVILKIFSSVTTLPLTEMFAPLVISKN